MAKSSVTDRDLGWKDIKKNLKELSRLAVKIGILEGSKTKDGADIAEYAAYNEEGTKNIPSRPFIRSWVDSNGEKLRHFMDSAYSHVVSGKWTARDAFERLGQTVQSGIKKNIVSGGFKPNSDSTVKRKGSSTPLVDSGDMRNAVNYKVVKE